MKICIIGGSGFIGTELCRQLEKKRIDFLIVDVKKSKAFPDKWIYGDVTDKESLNISILDTDIIINLAAEHRDDVRPLSLYTKVNVEGAKNISEVAIEKKINSIIFTSTVAIYGFSSTAPTEKTVAAPFNEYGRSKLAAEELFTEWFSGNPATRSLTIIRPTVVFGPGNRGNVFNLIKQIANRRFLMIGKGNNKKSLAYVENIASFIVWCCSSPQGKKIHNYVDKPDFTMNQLVCLIEKNLGKNDVIKLRIPYYFALWCGYLLDIYAVISRKSFSLSSIRVKKFCADTVYKTNINETGFNAPINLQYAIDITVKKDFHKNSKPVKF